MNRFELKVFSKQNTCQSVGILPFSEICMFSGICRSVSPFLPSLYLLLFKTCNNIWLFDFKLLLLHPILVKVSCRALGLGWERTDKTTALGQGWHGQQR